LGNILEAFLKTILKIYWGLFNLVTKIPGSREIKAKGKVSLIGLARERNFSLI